MIPESKLLEILRSAEMPCDMETLARHITRESFRVMQEEQAPEGAQLLAACQVLTDYAEKHREVEIYASVSGAIYVGDTRRLDGAQGSNVAQTLILFAEKVLRDQV